MDEPENEPKKLTGLGLLNRLGAEIVSSDFDEAKNRPANHNLADLQIPEQLFHSSFPGIAIGTHEFERTAHSIPPEFTDYILNSAGECDVFRFPGETVCIGTIHPGGCRLEKAFRSENILSDAAQFVRDRPVFLHRLACNLPAVDVITEDFVSPFHDPERESG